MSFYDYTVETEKQRLETKLKINPSCIMHIHEGIEFVMVLEGILNADVGGRVFKIKAESALLIRSFEPHAYLNDDDNISLILEFPSRLTPKLMFWLNSHRSAGNMICISEKVFQCLIELLRPGMDNSGVIYDDFCQEAILSLICNEYIHNAELISGIRENEFPVKRSIVEKALNHIIQNIDNSALSEAETAHAAGVCRETLSRAFKSELGVSYTEYVHKMRINVAVTLLESGASVTEASMASGFESIRSFNRVFRGITGITPSIYLKKMISDL